MNNKRKPDIYLIPNYQKIIFSSVLFVIVSVMFYIAPTYANFTYSVDWKTWVYPVGSDLLHPYRLWAFVNPPWMAIILSPLHTFPQAIGAAVNAGLNFIVIFLLIYKQKGGLLPIILVFTSLPFCAVILNGQIEWVPALGFLIQNEWALPFMLAKPQSGLLAAFDWFLKSDRKWRYVIIGCGLLGLSFLVWGWWVGDLITNVHLVEEKTAGYASWSFSPFPYGIPFGLGLLFYIWKNRPANGEILGALSTYLLVPYFSACSLVVFFTLLSSKYRRISVGVWVLLWIIAAIK